MFGFFKKKHTSRNENNKYYSFNSSELDIDLPFFDIPEQNIGLLRIKDMSSVNFSMDISHIFNGYSAKLVKIKNNTDKASLFIICNNATNQIKTNEDIDALIPSSEVISTIIARDNELKALILGQ